MLVTIPYEPRPLWENVLHPALEKYRFAVIVAHRRYGKTVGMVNELIRKALTCERPAPMYAYIAPFRNQAKRIAWGYLKYYTSVIPERKVNETELYVEIPSQHENWNGARICIMGADNPDALRGSYWDGIVLDEYAQMPPTLYSSVIRAALGDREGFAYFIGTPKGQNAFYEIYQRALTDDKWFSCLYRVDETGVLPAEEVEDMKKDMTEIEVRQELYCDFTASSGNVVIPIDLVTEAAHRKIDKSEIDHMPVILGVDVARYGGDRSVIFRRQGNLLFPASTHQGLDNMELAARVAMEINAYQPRTVFIDAGAMGAGVIDRLRQLGFKNIVEVPFGSRAQDDKRYENIRAEMYFKARTWLAEGGAIPDDPMLKSELSATEYKFAKSGRIVLEPKEDVVQKIGRSPDLADAMMLTFALPVNMLSPGLSRFRKRAKGRARDYDPLKRM